MKWKLQTFSDHVNLSLLRPDDSIVFGYVLRDVEEAETFKSAFRKGAEAVNTAAQTIMQIN